MTVAVNDIEISEQDIAAETQNHPSESFDQARAEAARALAIRELLVQEAGRLGFVPDRQAIGDGKWETDEDSLIRQLLEHEVETPEADEAACRRYYDNNPARFRSPDLYEAAHIFFPADPEDGDARKEAEVQAKAVIEILQGRPDRFAEFARSYSACTSAQDGGSLGQVARGQTLPEFETFLDNLEEGQLCPVPVPTRYGLHIVRLDHRREGAQLPFDHVKDRIAAYLNAQVWNRAVAQYIRILAGRHRVQGIDLGAVTTPLVQ